MTQLSRLEWVILNQTVKGREHFIFNTSEYSNPLGAIVKRDKVLSDIQNKLGKPIPKWKLPKEAKSFNPLNEFNSDNVVDNYIGISRAAKGGRTNKKATTEVSED
jgi:hypothetical protein